MEDVVRDNLEQMTGEPFDRIPAPLVRCVERTEELIRVIKPLDFVQHQVLAWIVADWERNG